MHCEFCGGNEMARILEHGTAICEMYRYIYISPVENILQANRGVALGGIRGQN